MSRFWNRIVRLVPPFGGDDNEAATNIDSHNWRVVRLSQLYSEADETWPAVVECRDCRVVADSESAKYPCGTAPKPVSLRDWKNRRR